MAVLLSLFFFLLPTQLGKHFFFDFSYINGVRIDYLAPTLYLTDLLALILVILNVKKLLPWLKKKEFGIFVSLLIFSIILSVSKPIALYYSLKVLLYVLLFSTIHALKFDHRKILYALLAGTLLQLLLVLIQFITKGSVQGVFYWFGERAITLGTPDVAKASLQGIEFLRPYGTFSHPNSMGGFYLLLYFFTLVYKSFSHFPRLKTILLFVSACLVFLSFSKAAILTFFVLNIFWLIKKRGVINCTFCIFARIAVLFALILVFVSAQGDKFSTEKRLILMEHAVNIITEHPITGVGLGNYLIAQSTFPMQYAYHFLQPVHNIFLLFISETGLIGVVFAIFFFMKVGKKITNHEELLMASLVILCTGMVDHYWLTLHQNMLLIPVVFGLLIKELERKV